PLMNTSAQDSMILDFDQFATDVFNQSEIPGMAIAITDQDHILYAKGFGVTSLENPHPVTPDTIFLINSMSKAFTSALTGILVDRGVLSWNDTIISVLPDFALNDPETTRKITIGDLLVHNSGLFEYDGDLLFRMGLNPNEIVHQMRYLETEKSFRSGYGYNNLHYFVVSEVINKKTGYPLSSDLKDLILTPLGMQNTSIGFDFLSSPEATRYGYADHHVISANGYVPVPMDKEYLNGEYGEVGAGGISSNVIDMAKWLRLWLNGGEISGNRVLQNETIKEILRPANTIASGPGFNFTYAKGWVVKCDPMLPHPVIWHNGGTAGMSSYNGFIPEEGIGIVVLTNAGENGIADFIGDTFMFMISNRADYHEFTNISTLGSDIRPTVPVSVYSEVKPGIYDYPGFAGSYQNNYYGTMNIRNESGDFIAELGPRPLKLNLTPVNKTSCLFRFEPLIQNVSVPDGLFSFTYDAGNRVETISAQGLTNPEHPPVVFSRVV
ncbi:MAG TPA: serine hydrolase domain-containing protein, partial [Methanospirillum sp.]|uniref:serine hydrolase domain-containing protein n=1 Tax=Methanospirillum sp. TaxID=45200 RepID=UPI002CA55BD2